MEEKAVQCPYCWETFTLLVDPSEGKSQKFVYDCEVCCRPIDVSVQIRARTIEIQTKQGFQI